MQGHAYFEVQMRAQDSVGNTIEKSFRASLRDPIIELEKFYTNPAEPEESVRSEVHFDLAGDTDLVSTAEIGVDKIKLSTADVFKNYDPEKAGYTLHLSIQKFAIFCRLGRLFLLLK